MKRLQKKMGTVLVLLLSSCILCACGGSSKSATESITYDSAAPMMEEAAAEAGGLSLNQENAASAATRSESTAAPEIGRKLIRTVDMDVETEHYEELMASLEEQIAELEGYIEYKEAYHGSLYGSGNRSARLTVRIPASRLGEFTTRLKASGNVIRESESTEDVTLTYVDLESHKAMLKAQQESLISMLEQARSIEDIIALESRLAEVRYQLESMESQLRTYDNLVEYSTVNLYIEEVERYTPQPEVGTWDRIRSGFSENLYLVGNGIRNFFIELIIALPLIAVWVVLIVILIVLVRNLIKWERKHSSRNREQKVSGNSEGSQQRGIPLIRQKKVQPPQNEGKESNNGNDR